MCVDVLVSTDDQEIAEISRQYDALVPWLRPQEISTDTASSVDVVLHALTWYENENGKVDGVMLLQPTSPFRTVETIRTAVTLFKQGQGRHPIVSVSPAHTHPAWCFKLDNHHMTPFVDWDNVSKRSQDLEPVYALNGSVYLIQPQRLKDDRSFIAEDTQAFVVNDPKEDIDIDTAFDWIVAETILGSLTENVE